MAAKVYLCFGSRQYLASNHAIQDQGAETDEKVEDNNAIFATLMSIFLDGQAIYRDNAALHERFVFTHVLKIVRGSQGKTKTIDIAADTREFVDRVVKNSQITNTGAVNLLVESGNVPAPTPTAINLALEESITRPEASAEVSVFNTDPAVAGQFTVRVTVD